MPESAGIAQPRAGKRVLVVDDLRDSADSLATLLEECGHAVRTAYDGEAGVAAAAAFDPDVVLLDLGMPKLNGYEACRRIRQRDRVPYVIALTGWGHEDDRRKSSDAGFDQHLVKPVDVDALLKILDTLPRNGTA
jgi:DNA-binding response OmpR family regulator